MPEINADINIEVYCDTCGNGICRYSRGIGTTLYVDACPYCMKEKQTEIDNLESIITDQENKINDLQEEINRLNDILSHELG